MLQSMYSFSEVGSSTSALMMKSSTRSATGACAFLYIRILRTYYSVCRNNCPRNYNIVTACTSNISHVPSIIIIMMCCQSSRIDFGLTVPHNLALTCHSSLVYHSIVPVIIILCMYLHSAAFAAIFQQVALVWVPSYLLPVCIRWWIIERWTS